MSDSLLTKVLDRAASLGTPITAHLDLTYRCNERCAHCYVEHGTGPELTMEEVINLLEQLEGAGTLFLVLSGGEIFLRTDLFEILDAARRLRFSIRLKTNGTLVIPEMTARLKRLGIEEVDISLYSHQAETHDAITLLPGSFQQSLAAIRDLRAQGINVVVTFLLTRQNRGHFEGVRQLAMQLGAACSLDPSVTPKLDGDTSVLQYRASQDAVAETLKGTALAPSSANETLLNALPCKAGHSSVYINPFGLVYPCVAFPLLCGDVRRASFSEIWYNAQPLRRLRAVRWRDLPACSQCRHANDCGRCPGLAFMEGDMLGPSQVDCDKSELRNQLTILRQTLGTELRPESKCERG